MIESQTKTILKRRRREKARTESKRLSERLSMGSAWNTYGSSYKIYSKYFDLEENVFPDFVDAIKQTRQPFALDLLSCPAMLRSLDLPGISVGLTDTRNGQEVQEDKGKRWFISGDFNRQRKSLWVKIREQMGNLGISGFDLIIQRGLLGFDMLTPDPFTHFYHLNQMWQVLTPGGMILTQISTWDRHCLEMHQLLNYWNTLPGIFVRASGLKGLMLSKGNTAPPALPLNFAPSHRELKSWWHQYNLKYLN